MKKAFSLIISAVILLQSFSKLVILANYEFNKEFISRTLCENRYKPALKCNGKCQLKKELTKDESRQNSQSNPLKEKNDVQMFNISGVVLAAAFSILEPVSYSSYQPAFSSSHLSSVFHPPQC